MSTNQEKGIRVFFGIPAYGGMLMASFVRSYLQTQRAGLLDRVCHIDGDSLVCRARNNLTAEFLKSDCTHLLFIDTDIVFSPGQVEKLIQRASEGYPIVAGLYPKKQRELAWVLNTIPGEKTRPDGLRRVKYAGTGFMLISREAFTRIINAYPEIAYTTDHGEIGKGDERETRWDFWRVGVYRSKEQEEAGSPGRYLSEDWYFCQLLEDLGIPIMMDMSIHTKHIGQVAYPLEDVPLQNSDGKILSKEELASLDEPTAPTEQPKQAQPPREIKSAQMNVPDSMKQHIQKIFLGEYHFENPTKDGDLILDIGGNVGGFARWAHLCWPTSKIISYEPIKANFELLKENTDAIPEIERVQKAVYPTLETTFRMFHGVNNPGECSFFTDLGNQNEESFEEVEVIHPASLPKATFLKVDTEGAELAILNEYNLEDTKAVVLEWHRESDYFELKKLMDERGFLLVRDDKRGRNIGIMAFVRKPCIKEVENVGDGKS